MANPAEVFPTIGSIAEKTESSVTNDSNENKPLIEVESLCMKCEQMGTTRMLLTSIPSFREIIVSSFICEHCGNRNSEVQSAGAIRPEGMVYIARIASATDLNRQIVRSSTCTVTFPEYELTLPAHRGQLTTVEGLIRNIIADLSFGQPLRCVQDEAAYTKIAILLTSLKGLLGDQDSDNDDKTVSTPEPSRFQPFTIEIDDPAGNSFIEFIGGLTDPCWSFRTYTRTPQQNASLGLASEQNTAISQVEDGDNSRGQDSEDPEHKNEEIYEFLDVCPRCKRDLHIRMKQVAIPYFKDILIMSTNCDECGYRDNEVKSGTAISDKGKRITLKVEDREDLSRDILKSETAGLVVPDIDLTLQPGTLGGRFTTVEGILEQVYEELSQKVSIGDSSVAPPEDHQKFQNFLDRLAEVKSAARPFTLILDDPLANSYIQNLCAPDPDPNMLVEMYDRTWQQNEELGLNDIKVEDYKP